MSKIRVYELARELSIESKMLVSRLQGMGMDVATHQSTLTAEQVLQARKALRGDDADSDDKGPKVIRRRRRAVSAEEPAADESSLQEETKAADAPAATVADEEPAEEALSQEVEPMTAASSEEPVQEVVEDVAAAPEVRKPVPPKPVGATIVRRASPEEVEAQKARERDGGPKRSPKRDAIVQEDKGLRSYRAGHMNPEVEDQSGKGRWKELKSKTFKTEVEEAVPRKLPPKQKRTHLNIRSLLDDLDGGVVDDVGDAHTKRRTVYTPTASSKKRDLKRRKDLKKTQITTPRAAYRVVKMGEAITVAELGKQLGVKGSDLIKKLMGQGMMVTLNQTLDYDTTAVLASEYNYEVQSNVVSFEDLLNKVQGDAQEREQTTRPPIVTIMGHVDHGKTSILDAIRKARVAEGEAGGITQHIGAYTVEVGGKTIAFLDTPGHEAFSAMRSRGAQVTDIVVLVVAADDGVMPQTVEAISHAREAGVPLIVAINKIDKPNKNLDRVFTELTEHGVQSEEWGGDTQFVKVSALQNIGLDELLEAINLQAEILELKAAHDGPAEGVIVESHLDKGRGPVATIMVQQGCLNIGDVIVAGTVVGKVRGMNNHLGQRQESAGPSTPVEVIGLPEVPLAGDMVNTVSDEKAATELAEWRRNQLAMANKQKSSAATLEQLLQKVQGEKAAEVAVIIKADTQGSVEAISDAVLKLNTERVRNRIVHKAVGGVTESDITLAQTSGAIVIAFNVRAGRGLDEFADKAGVLISYFSIIYDIENAIKSVMAGKLPPILTEVVQGRGEVRQTIKVPKIGVVAGTAITDGKITRNSHLRLIRDNVVIYDGKVGSLRRFKDDVKEVSQGYECGVGIDGCNDIREGDVIESYVIQEEAATL